MYFRYRNLSEIKYKKVDKKILKLSMDETYDVYFYVHLISPGKRRCIKRKP